MRAAGIHLTEKTKEAMALVRVILTVNGGEVSIVALAAVCGLALIEMVRVLDNMQDVYETDTRPVRIGLVPEWAEEYEKRIAANLSRIGGESGISKPAN